MKPRRPKLEHWIPPWVTEPTFQVVEHTPGSGTYWLFKIKDAILGDEPYFIYTPPKKGCPFSVDRLACAAAGELTEARGQITIREFVDGIPTFLAVYVSNSRQVFCVSSSDPTRAQPVDVQGLAARAREALAARGSVPKKEGLEPMYDGALLSASLDVAVPMWIERLKRVPWSEIEARLPQIIDTIASRGDIILYKSKKKGETAAAFNDLAEGLAILSFAPGGVKAFGSRWQATHPDRPDLPAKPSTDWSALLSFLSD